MDVVGDHAELSGRPVETSWLGQRAADVFQSALPMRAHRTQPELVVPGVALVDLGLVDQVDDVVGAMAKAFVRTVSCFIAVELRFSMLRGPRSGAPNAARIG